MSTSSTDSVMKYCRDCHFVRNRYTDTWKCAAPQNLSSEIHLVTGDIVPITFSAAELRYNSQEYASREICGPDAKWFKSTKEVLAERDTTISQLKKEENKSLRGTLLSDL